MGWGSNEETQAGAVQDENNLRYGFYARVPGNGNVWPRAWNALGPDVEGATTAAEAWAIARAPGWQPR